MIIDEKGLSAAMKQAYKKKSTGYKVAAQRRPGMREEIVLVAPSWTAIITREFAPRKVMGLIVEHLGDLPSVHNAWHVQDEQTQTEIFDMAVPEKAELIPEAEVSRTALNWNGYQVWQRKDNLQVFMIDPRVEDLLVNYNMTVGMTEDGQFYVEGVASKLYFKPLQVMQGEMPALHHLAELRWV